MHFKKHNLIFFSVFTLFILTITGCGQKEPGEQSIQHTTTTSVKFEGSTPSVHKKTLADEEIEKNKRLLETNPKDAKAYYNLGLLYDEKGMLDESLDAYKKASEIDPMMVESFVGQGNVLNKKGKSDEAISVFKKALEIDSHHASAYEGLGLVYIHKTGRRSN